MIRGSARIANKIKPSGKRPKSPPLVSTITTGCTSITASAQRHGRSGAAYPSSAASAMQSGYATDQYNGESQASRRPLAAIVASQSSVPPPNAAA